MFEADPTHPLPIANEREQRTVSQQPLLLFSQYSVGTPFNTGYITWLPLQPGVARGWAPNPWVCNSWDISLAGSIMPFYRLSSSFLLARAPTAILGHEVSLEMETTPRINKCRHGMVSSGSLATKPNHARNVHLQSSST